MKLRVGLVGLGKAWEARHRPALRALADRFEVRAVCEEVLARADRAAGEFGAKSVDGFRVLAARADIDAVLMLSPQWYGPLPIYAACDHGKAIYCAGTLNIQPEEVRKIQLRVDQAGIAFMCESPRRHAPATLRLKELIATRLGQPHLLFCHQRLSVRNENHERDGFPAESATQSLLELVDWCRYVVGREPRSVMGSRHTQTPDDQNSDYEMMSVDFSDPSQAGCGAMAQISCGHYIPEAWQEAITFRPPSALQVCCEHGIAFVDLPSTVVWFDQAGRHMESLENERPVGEQLLSQFYRSVTSLVRKSTGLEDSCVAMSTVIAARASALDGQRMSLEN